MRAYHLGLAAFAAVALSGTAHAQAVSYSKDIVPIFKAQCIKCHGTAQPQGGLSLASFAALDRGGKGGKVLAPKAAESRLVKMIDGPKPAMPPGGALKPADVAKIKAWVDQGAKPDVDPNLVVIPDSAIPAIQVPKIPVRGPRLPEATALAWSKDNKILAIGTYQIVRLVDPATGLNIRELKGHADKVHCLQFSPDGKLLAAAGGPPAQQGEIKIWEVASGLLMRTIVGHTDYVYSCSWSPDGKNIASASYDKLIKIWDVAAGTEVKTLKDHADAVYAVAYHPNGQLLASGSADRSVKVWDIATGKRIYTLSGHGDIVFSLAFNAQGTQLTSTGGDKTVRTWNVNAAGGQQARNTNAHEKTVNEVVYSQDGTLMATASDDKSVKIWNAGNGATLQTIKDQPDAMLSAAFSPDNKLVAVGGFDGTVKIFNVADGKPVSTVIDLPKLPEKAPKVDPKPAPAKPDPKAAPAPKAGAKAARR